jgi:hypothetical protein
MFKIPKKIYNTDLDDRKLRVKGYNKYKKKCEQKDEIANKFDLKEGIYDPLSGRLKAKFLEDGVPSQVFLTD